MASGKAKWYYRKGRVLRYLSDRAGVSTCATGTRLVNTVLYELRRRKKKYGLATACIGGGQGIAMVVESFH